MENNVMRNANGQFIIINGGNGLNDCPKDWDEANAIIKEFNAGKSSKEPRWDFDCGFKLDYNGKLLQIYSRFYPPKTHSGLTWDGNVSVYLLEEKVHEKSFDCKTIGELKQEVESYVSDIINKINKAIKPLFTK